MLRLKTHVWQANPKTHQVRISTILVLNREKITIKIIVLNTPTNEQKQHLG